MFLTGLVLLIPAVDLGIKDIIEGTDSSAFPKELEGSGGMILLHKNHNGGFPFGFLKDRPDLVRGVPLIITSAVGGVFLWLCSQKGHTAEKVGFAMVLGGALSNLYDRLVRHYVVDYFSFQWKWLKKVVFNLGDIFIFLGAGMMLALELIHAFKGK